VGIANITAVHGISVEKTKPSSPWSFSREDNAHQSMEFQQRKEFHCSLWNSSTGKTKPEVHVVLVVKTKVL